MGVASQTIRKNGEISRINYIAFLYEAVVTIPAHSTAGLYREERGRGNEGGWTAYPVPGYWLGDTGVVALTSGLLRVSLVLW